MKTLIEEIKEALAPIEEKISNLEQRVYTNQLALVEDKNWEHKTGVPLFPHMGQRTRLLEDGTMLYELQTDLRFEREGIWYKILCRHTFKMHSDSNIFDIMGLFIMQVYSIQQLQDVTKEYCGPGHYLQPDKSQISEIERLEALGWKR